jgi:N,N-dimethylformamidase beta subunit-like, C-terminal
VGRVIALSPRHGRASRAIPVVLAVAVVGVACWDRWSERIAVSAAAELEGRAPTPSELVPSVEAAFARESYPPGATATLVISNRAHDLRLQVLRSGPERIVTRSDLTMNGVPVTPVRWLGSSTKGRTVRIRIGSWPSGLYVTRLRAADGRVGFAPFVVRPKELGEHRIAVVMPTLTWQAYNLRDEDGDGRGDSWYAHWHTKKVRLGRPFLSRGVPYNFRRYDLPFLTWLERNRKSVDVLSQSDLEAVPSSRRLAAAYDLIVFPGHHEYVTTREYDLVEGYRDRGGNLMFLSANNYFWQVVRHGGSMTKTRLWRDLGRPEAGLIGVQYLANGKAPRRPWIVRRSRAGGWIFAGTSLREGSSLGLGGVEIDRTFPASPAGVEVLAEIPHLFGPGMTAQMTYYKTTRGAKVFAAGAFYFTRLVHVDPLSSRVLDNLWERMATR